MAAVALFHGRRFYLTRAMAPQQRQRVRELIEERGGEVTHDLRGAIQLVGPEHLDPRQEWVSIDFVLDSVARGALQDLSDYMGQELAPVSPPQEQAQQSPAQTARGRRQKRIKYSSEDDARMLFFLQSNFGGLNKSMMSVPLSVWETAARKKVTNHSGQSMHERYRKQLRPKTPSERRAVISKGLKRTQAGSNEEDEDEEEVEEIDEDYESGDREAGASVVPSTAATPATTTEQTQAPPAAAAAEEQTPTSPVARSPRDKTPPPRVSMRVPTRRHIDSSSEEEEEEGEEEEEEEESESESRGRKRLRRSTPEKEPASANAEQPATALESTDVPSLKWRLRSQSSPMLAVGRPPLHREPTRRQTIGIVTRNSTRGVGITVPVPPPRSSSSEEEEEKEGGEEEEAEKEEEQKGGEKQRKQAIESDDTLAERGVVFSSVWATAIADRANQRRLHDLFESSAGATTTHLADSPAESSPPISPREAPGQADDASPVPTQAAPAPPSSAAATSERQHGSPESDATSTPQTTRKRSLSDAGDEQQALESPAEVELEVEHSTEQELDAQLARISFETNASQQAILHALYYSSGSYATATAFLQGRSPVGMWSPQDDLLLASLTNERTTTAGVKAAARAGVFASMRVQRSAADILARIRYLL